MLPYQGGALEQPAELVEDLVLIDDLRRAHERAQEKAHAAKKRAGGGAG